MTLAVATTTEPHIARPRWRARLHEIIFEADTRRGRAFDVGLKPAPGHGFTSIPTSMYWAVVTMTTVGYGDIAPRTPLGQFLAALLMILGYGIIAVPTGIVTVELANAGRAVSRQACPSCGAEGHAIDARHCKYCGARL